MICTLFDLYDIWICFFHIGAIYIKIAVWKAHIAYAIIIHIPNIHNFVFYFVMLMKIKAPHPSHPSTRVSIQMPSLGIHFSPAKYCWLMELVNIFYGTMETSEQLVTDSLQTEFAPWNPPDLATDTRILVWRVIVCLENVISTRIFLFISIY